MTRLALAGISAIAAIFGISSPATAQEPEVPYWAALDASEVNMRTGPSQNFPIEWVYKREGLPLKVVRTMQGWRYVQDPDGEEGWILGRLLTRTRGAIVTGEGTAEIRELPQTDAPLSWYVEPDVVGKLGDCTEGWCQFDTDGHAGWILEERLWGTGEP